MTRWFIWNPGTRKFCWVSLGERFEAVVLRFISNCLGNIQLVLGNKTSGIPAGDSQTKPSGLFCPRLFPAAAQSSSAHRTPGEPEGGAI